MAYTPNAAWISSTTITAAKLDNLETQYDESYSYFTAHNHDDLYLTKTEMEASYYYSGNDGPGSGADADLLYKSGGNLHGASFYGLGVPTGIIILWYGSVASIPAGWHLCDGSDGTIDLRGKFVPGAGGTLNPGTTGGSATFTASGTVTVDAHVLSSAEMAAHTHPFQDMTPAQGSYPHTANIVSSNVQALRYTTRSGTTASAGSGSGHGHSSAEGTAMAGDAVASLPRYYALAYIQKTA